MEEAEVWNWPSEAEEKAAAAPFNLKDVKCETVGGRRYKGGTLVSQDFLEELGSSLRDGGIFKRWKI